MKACANCGVSLADDQRYCLECGTRQVQARSQFLERFTPAAVGPQVSGSAAAPQGGRSANTTALAGIGVLLLAMGVGVLIGRASGNTGTSSPQVISVDSPASDVAGTGASASEPAGTAGSTTVPEDWPAGKSGYSVQLQTFSASTASASEVTAAKSSAQSKGASGVGILLSSNFASLSADQYVIYSGDYASEAQAKQELARLKSKFSSAAVIHVSGASVGGSVSPSSSPSSNGSAAKTGSTSSGKGSNGSSGSSGSSGGGHSAEQKSLSLPNVVTTG